MKSLIRKKDLKGFKKAHENYISVSGAVEKLDPKIKDEIRNRIIKKDSEYSVLIEHP